MATHSSILAWRTTWMEELGRLQPLGSQSQTQLSDQTTTTKPLSLWFFAKADPRADTGTMGHPPHLRLVWDSLHSWAVSEGRKNDLTISSVFIDSTLYRTLSSMRLGRGSMLQCKPSGRSRISGAELRGTLEITFIPTPGQHPWRLPPLTSWVLKCAGAKSLQSCPTLCDPMDCSPPAPLSMGFSRQEYWSGLPCLPPEDLPDPGIEPACLTSPALAGRLFTTGATWEAHGCPQACRKQGLGVGDAQKKQGQASPHAQAGSRACSLPLDRARC